MAWYYNILIIVVICAILGLLVARLHKRLINMWKEVSSKEVIFYRQLEKVTKLYYENRAILKTEDNNDFIKKITRYRKTRIRTALLSTRQDLFKAINIIYDEIEDVENDDFKVLKKEFRELQKVRRVYNSKVLIYNQTISVFPTRYLALRMNLEIKEYFG